MCRDGVGNVFGPEMWLWPRFATLGRIAHTASLFPAAIPPVFTSFAMNHRPSQVRNLPRANGDAIGGMSRLYQVR